MLFKVDPDPGKDIEVDPDPNPGQGSKWIRIWPNVVDPGGSGSETLPIWLRYFKTCRHCFVLQAFFKGLILIIHI